MNKRNLTLSLLAIFVIVASGCSSLPFISTQNATETPTRTPRPTFTPRVSVTDTPADTSTATPTAAATSTDTPPAPTDTLPAPTVKPVVLITKAPPPPTALPPPPQPVFPATFDHGFPCSVSNTYLVYLSFRQRPQPQHFIPGFTVALFDTSGRLAVDGAGNPLVAVTPPDGQNGTEMQSNCQIHGGPGNPIFFSSKIDASQAVLAGTTRMIFRFIKSVQDQTAQSADYAIDFTSPTNYWLFYYGSQ